jgi:hypothetical protein
MDGNTADQADATGMNSLRDMMCCAEADSLERLFAMHPYHTDADALVAFLSAALWKASPEDLATFCGISKTAAIFLTGHMVASAVVPDMEGLLVDELPGSVGEAIFEQAVKDSNFGELS